jgi:RNA polymerase sigma-70 factor (ECF subfamily)
MDEDARRKEEAAVDHALLRQALDGDEAGFAGLVERHQRRAYRVARNLVPTDEDAQDLAQEAFLRVFKSLDRFDFNHEFTTWLYRIVTNLCIDFLRKRRSAISVSSGRGDDDDAAFDLEDLNVASPSAEVEAQETAAEVAAVLETLAPHFQSVLNLREIEGLSCPEIAEIVGAHAQPRGRRTVRRPRSGPYSWSNRGSRFGHTRTNLGPSPNGTRRRAYLFSRRVQAIR